MEGLHLEAVTAGAGFLGRGEDKGLLLPFVTIEAVDVSFGVEALLPSGLDLSAHRELGRVVGDGMVL
jgi:hypothetical protein